MRGQYLLQTASTRELLCGEWERKDSTGFFQNLYRGREVLYRIPLWEQD